MVRDEVTCGPMSPLILCIPGIKVLNIRKPPISLLFVYSFILYIVIPDTFLNIISLHYTTTPPTKYFIHHTPPEFRSEVHEAMTR